ncbi:MAG: hypothetical protein K2M41_08170 [Muribaculaceae bacterium]|nr:hypothetical protein [Muribaculaceae bacterium]
MTPRAKTILKWVILSLLIAYVVGMGIWARGEAERNTCRSIVITMGEKGLSDTITVKGVRTELMKYQHRIIGAKANTINTLDIRQYLMRLNNFEDVECYLATDGKLHIRISPMIPEIRVFDGADSYYVNKDGKRIKSNAEFFTQVPIVTGNFRNTSPQVALPIVRFVENDKELRELIGMYYVQDADNIILIPRITGHVINFGDTTRLKEKRRMLMTAYKNIIPYKGWEEYDTISVRFKGQIVATRRNKAPLYPIESYLEEIDPEDATLPEATPADTTAVRKTTAV